MRKVANLINNKSKPIKLTKNIDAPFVICFKDKLESNYNFDCLEKNNNKQLQGFLDRVSQLSVNDVDKQYRRPTDNNDKYCGKQVFHYEVSKGFRLHVVNYNGYYQVIRLDPNHKVHK